MNTKRDVIYTIGFSLVSMLFTAVLCLANNYVILPTNMPQSTIIEHMLFDKREMFLSESSLYSAPYVCDQMLNVWFIVFLPLLASIPFLMQFAGELRGFCRMKIIRTRGFSKYWCRIFLQTGLSGALCVTMGYMLFSTAVYSYFPHIYEYPDSLNTGSSTPQISVRIPLKSPLNDLFYTQSELVFWLNRAIVIFTFVFFISSMCLVLFLVSMNRYKAIGLPMIMFYLLDRLSNSLYTDSWNWKYFIINPIHIIFHTSYTFESWGLNYWWYFVFFVLLTAALYLLGNVTCRKRVMN